MCDAFNRARDRVAHGVVLIKAAHEVVVDHIAGVVLDHAYFLPDDALLFLNALRREIGGGDKLQKSFEVFLEF